MWEIKCIVSDKKALDVMKFLDGLTLEPPVIQYIHGPHNEVAPALNEKTRNSIEQLRKFIHGRKTVTPSEMRIHLEQNGYSKNGYSYALKILQDRGLLKKSKGTPSRYEVV